MRCPVCQSSNNMSWSFCQYCGAQLPKLDKSAIPVVPVPSTHLPAAASPKPSPIERYDGAIPGEMISCQLCGFIGMPGDKFCSKCGAPIPSDATVSRGLSAFTLPPEPRLRHIDEGGGSGEVYKLTTAETVIGRKNGTISFPQDGYMSSEHARIVRRGNRFVLVDEKSRNGTFIKIDGETELRNGDIILVGKQLFRFETT
ncbi:MAG: FHA domain-containing protein [Acidobacteriota bacterium]